MGRWASKAVLVALITAGNHKTEIEAVLSLVMWAWSGSQAPYLIFTFMGTAVLAAAGKLTC